MSAPPFHIPPVATHLLDSKQIDQTYQIQVMQPLMKKGATERFPVLYLTDGNLLFDSAKGIAQSLQVMGQVRRFILVGIGYPGTNPFQGEILRRRDLTPVNRPELTELMGIPIPADCARERRRAQRNRHRRPVSKFRRKCIVHPRVAARAGISLRRAICVQKPYLERRVLLTLKKQWRDCEFQLASPQIPFERHPSPDIIKLDKLINELVGQVDRVEKYPALGFTESVEIPKEVLIAKRSLVDLGFSKHLVR